MTVLVCFCSVVFTWGAVRAQQPAPSNSSRALPDSPAPKQNQQTENNATNGSQRFVGYLTKRSLFFPDIAASPGPLSTWQKFELFGNQAISPETILTSSISAGVSQARDVPYAYGEGGEAYGKRFGASMARGASNNFFGTFVLGSALHQDPRFFPRSNPKLWSTMKYAARRLVITRNDSGEEVVNTSGLIGPMAGEALANAYLPASEQTAGRTFTRVGSDYAWRFVGYVLKEYWPSVFHSLGLQRLKVLPEPQLVPDSGAGNPQP
jgi:hypothetical protein